MKCNPKIILATVFLVLISKEKIFSQYYDPTLSNSLIDAGAVLNGLSGVTLLSSIVINSVKTGSANTADGLYYDNTNNITIPPNISLGLASIALGSASVYLYKDNRDYYLDRRAYKMGIADIALGCADIILPPIFRLIFMGTNKENTTSDKKPPVDLSLYMPYSPKGNMALGFTVRKTF